MKKNYLKVTEADEVAECHYPRYNRGYYRDVIGVFVDVAKNIDMDEDIVQEIKNICYPRVYKQKRIYGFSQGRSTITWHCPDCGHTWSEVFDVLDRYNHNNFRKCISCGKRNRTLVDDTVCEKVLVSYVKHYNVEKGYAVIRSCYLEVEYSFSGDERHGDVDLRKKEPTILCKGWADSVFGFGFGFLPCRMNQVFNDLWFRKKPDANGKGLMRRHYGGYDESMAWLKRSYVIRNSHLDILAGHLGIDPVTGMEGIMEKGNEIVSDSKKRQNSVDYEALYRDDIDPLCMKDAVRMLDEKVGHAMVVEGYRTPEGVRQYKIRCSCGTEFDSGFDDENWYSHEIACPGCGTKTQSGSISAYTFKRLSDGNVAVVCYYYCLKAEDNRDAKKPSFKESLDTGIIIIEPKK